MSVIRSVILGVGGYLPEKVLTNEQLSAFLDTSDEWITQRTGIKRRHIAADGEWTSDLGAAAATRALESAGLSIDEIDIIIVATATPDKTFPSTAVSVQSKLGMKHGAAFDIHAVCSGFVYALSQADSLIKSGQANCVLVIGAETFSRLVDWTDRTTCVLFGDGAGAVVLGKEEQAGTLDDRGIFTTHLRSDGSFQNMLCTDGGPSSTGTVGHVKMEGREVFKHAVSMITDVIEDAFAKTGFTAEDIDWFVPHQANIRIIDASARKLGIPSEKVIRTVESHGNTSAASIPLALSVAAGDGRIHRGNLLLLESMGGGFTWASALLRW